MIPPFVEFPKIARLSREVIVTEKIDGTNAQVYIEEGDNPDALARVNGMSVFAGSRNRWLTLEQDNFGFARWVFEHASELALLGVGKHYGEWWGLGIQRGYGMKEKAFSLFNQQKWAEARPACCRVVPVLWSGIFDTRMIDACLTLLAREGSNAAPGFMDPEGVVVYHVAGNLGFKKTIKRDEEPKSKSGK